MADFSSLIQGDYGLRQQSKLPVMSAVGSGGSVFANPNRAEGVHEGDLSFKNATSSLGKTLDESFSASGVSFDDVFGGPPKYAMSLFASQALAVEVSLRAPTRVSSFRGASLPVFELPVFGEDDPNSIIGQKQVAYDDNFNDRSIFGGLPSMNLSSGSLMGPVRSKASSPALSHRHSPAHPGDSMFYSTQDDEAFVTGTVRPLKARLAAGKPTRFPSFSSLEDNKGKPGDSHRIVSKADPVILSVPSSPPKAGHWDYLRNLARTRKGNTVRPVRNEIDTDLDDVYRGFPRTSNLRSSHSFPAVQQVASQDDKSNSKTGMIGPIEKPSLKGRKPESKLQGSSFMNDGTVIPALFTPASSIDAPGLHDDFIELRMDRHLEPAAPEKEKAGDWTMGSPERQATVKASYNLDTPLRFKSWKDWVCEIPQNYQSADVPSPFVPAATPEEVRESVDDGSLCGFIDEWVKSVSDLLPEQEDRNSSEVSLLGKKVQAQESVKDTIDDKKLQGLLETAWKINEEKAGEKTLTKTMQEAEDVNEDISIGLHWKELRKQTSRHRNVSQSKDRQGRGEGTETAIERGDFSNHVSQKTPLESKDMLRTERSVKQAPVISEDFSVEWLEASKSDMVARRGSDKAEDSVKEQVSAVTAGTATYSSVTGTKPVSVAVPRATSIERCAMGVIEGEKTKESLTEQQITSHPERVPSDRTSSTSCASSDLTDQLVETADFQIKRWATGKEGNIRALLSNLQHVLWQGCGWQPIPLTDLIEGSAVKKAYRKATLFVHPDKMQQKGATIQQKYVAERVFDILQEAWKTFSYQDFL